MLESEQLWVEVLKKSIEAGVFPVQITSAHIELMKMLVNEEEARGDLISTYELKT